MDGSQFLSLALRLSNSSNEADLRSAVSRAYYGAFHVARSLLTNYGVRLAKTSECHQVISRCLQSGCTDEDAVLAGRELDSLRTYRNEADYDLDSKQFTSKSVSAQVSTAIWIVDAIGRCSATTGTIRENVRQYAKEVLRLPVI